VNLAEDPSARRLNSFILTLRFTVAEPYGKRLGIYVGTLYGSNIWEEGK
jgi:hypothetical protein